MAREVPDTGDRFRDITEIVRMLREPGGCPWDMKQTLETGVEDLLSEADEVREAMEKGDMENLREELGDLLWAITFTANIAREKDLFGMDDILKHTREKMVRRHPHVFGGEEAKSPEHAMELFQKAKEIEKHGKRLQEKESGKQ
jgi:uncharacterized protein YabN with tetrapyrrole methylase and pyrophosphatase domain